MDLSRAMRMIFSPWVIGGAVALAAALACFTSMLVLLTRPDAPVSSPPTAVLNIIPFPSSTPVANTATPTVVQQPTGEAPPAPVPGLIITGDFVQISGTGGDGLKLRSQPGTGSEVNFLAYEGEIFQVRDGPQESDGYVWWYLVAPYDQSVQGWAASNYLLVVPNP